MAVEAISIHSPCPIWRIAQWSGSRRDCHHKNAFFGFPSRLELRANCGTLIAFRYSRFRDCAIIGGKRPGGAQNDCFDGFNKDNLWDNCRLEPLVERGSFSVRPAPAPADWRGGWGGLGTSADS